MTWQPMSTAPTDEFVWITRVWSGIRIVARDYYPYRAGALAWQPIDWEPPEPYPYTGSVEDLPASPDLDPRDAEIERLRAEVERLGMIVDVVREYAHDHSTGPAIEDALWNVRSLIDRLDAANGGSNV